ncbi:MAG: hypothetical protein Q4G33_01300 [bacterium]|nr:hypothetical protein [bacterium]
MKFFGKKAAAAFITALSLIASSAAPVFAEGSKEMTTVPAGDGDLANVTGAYRPYLDWRDRDQFKMPSENVIYVYANEGEKIFFGSDVTGASDRSITAVVEPKTGFEDEKTINFSGQTYQGASIAVTLPEEGKTDTAVNPEKLNTDKPDTTVNPDKLSTDEPKIDSFADGNTLETTTEPDRNKIYMFKVTENGAGHIANRAQEQKGPNGVGGTTDGYEPLSFTAPYTGTYSFRFLSSEYDTSDIPDVEAIPAKNRTSYATIDFDGAEVGSMTQNEMYYEQNLGYVNFYNIYGVSGVSNRTASIEAVADGTTINVPVTDYSEAKIYQAGKKYLHKTSNNATKDGGSVGFTPLHSNIELEIVWQKAGEDTNKRTLYVVQGDRETKIDTTDTNVKVSKVTSIGGYPIKAGEEVRVFVMGGNNSCESKIYEIRYFYDKAVIPEYTAPPPTPAPVTTTINLGQLTAQPDMYTTDTTIGDASLYSATFYGATKSDMGNGTNDKNRGYTVTAMSDDEKTLYPGSTNKVYFMAAMLNLDENYEITAQTAAVLGFTPKMGKPSLEITWGPTSKARLHYQTGASEEKTADISELTTTTVQLTKDKTTYIFFDGATTIYELKYTYTPEDTVTASSSDETSAVSLMETEATQQVLSQSRFWDFYDIEAGVQYAAGSLYDKYLKANAGVTTCEGYIPLTNTGFEFTPAYSGSVEAIFETDNTADSELTVSQGDNTAVSVPANRENTESAKLENVAAYQPVKIYASKGTDVNLKSIRYTAGSNLANLARKVDDPWAKSPSEVAAWDVTVAKATTTTVSSTSWNIYSEFNGITTTTTSKDGKLKVYYSGTAPDSNNEKMAIKLNAGSYKNSKIEKNVFEYTPEADGKISVTAYSTDAARKVVFTTDPSTISNNPTDGEGFSATSTDKVFSCDVKNNNTVYIYATAGVYFKTITFTPNAGSGTTVYEAQPGRAWADILFLNAGMYQRSMYSKLNILTKDGFLYDFKFNGIQPYGFVFYSNNRGFLYDPYSLSDKESWGESANTNMIQPLERSFLSKGNFDVGSAPEKLEKDANGNPVIYKDKQLKSRVLPNYQPVDAERDYTHKLFFNRPDEAALEAYTGNSKLKGEGDNTFAIQKTILDNLTYEGLGDQQLNPTAAPEASEKPMHYGTIGIGGEFKVSFTDKQWNALNTMGAKTIGVTLDFSGYELDESKKPVTVKDDSNWNIWKSRTDRNPTNAEKSNKVTLTAAIVGENKSYAIAWDGKDAYGNVVPEGKYNNNVTSFVELGTAHFPILDAEHNPNGIKLQLANNISLAGSTSETPAATSMPKDMVYYNNSAVSPQIDASAPTNWLYANWASAVKTPSKIGDGENHVDGVQSNYNTNAADGAMRFGGYDKANDTAINSDADAGYGNYAALDIWTKYEVKQDATIAFGVKAAESVPAYVSFVAEDGTASPKDNSTELTESHLKFRGGELPTEGSKIKGKAGIYGNTISTGFLTKFKTDTNVTDNYITWEITIPKIQEGGKSYGETYIKLPVDTPYETASLDAAALYDTFVGVTEDTAADDDVLNIGDEVSGDENADMSSSDTEVDMTQKPDEGGESIADDEAAQQFLLEASAETQTGTSVDAKLGVDGTAVLTDTSAENASGTQIYNAGSIHRVSFENLTGDSLTLKIKQQTVVSGGTDVVIGLVIDNLYAPNATAKATYGDANVEQAYRAINAAGYQDYLKVEGNNNGYDPNSNEKYITKESK